MGQYDEALNYSQRALEISIEMDDHLGIVLSYKAIAKIYQDKGNIDLAITNAKKSIKLSQEMKYVLEENESAVMLYECYQTINNPKEALKYFELHIGLRDSINSESNQRASIQQEYRFEYEKAAAQDSIAHLHEQEVQEAVIEKKEVQLDSERKQKYGLYGFSVLILVLAVILFRGFKRKKKDNKISQQKLEVEEQRKKILDSITYAENIQQSLLPSSAEIKNYLSGFSALYLPKDIVSGDFYWFYHDENRSYLALSDCTGHGVPGAFMTMMGSMLLKEIIADGKEKGLAEILEKLDLGVIQLLKQEDADASEDGMETALICFDHEQNKMTFAGANQNIYLVRDEVEVVRGTVRSIGGWVRKRSRLPNFETKNIDLNGVTAFYLCTDGLEDQFGDSDGKLFTRERFIGLIQEMGGQPDMSVLEKEFHAWKGSHEQIDDICIVGIKV